MAEVAPASKSETATHKVKPEKPDEEKYKAALAKAEKELSAAQEKHVSMLYSSSHTAIHWNYTCLPTSYPESPATWIVSEC